MTDIYIISGFLGAGKTTLIQKLLQNYFAGRNVVLIENDFGEVNVDAALLKESGFTVKEMSNGCICCTLSGDFVQAINEVNSKYQPDIILVEPSGVGKLSDIEHACCSGNLPAKMQIHSKITVVDAAHCRSYLENFGEFFEDQVKKADVLLLTRSDSQNTPTVKTLLHRLNPAAPVALTDRELIRFLQGAATNTPVHTNCTHHACDEHHCHHHDNEPFETVTLTFKKAVDLTMIQNAVTELNAEKPDNLLRMKGILKVQNSYVCLQYVPGEFNTQHTAAQGNYLCFIGRKLDSRLLLRFFKEGTVL